MGTGEDSFHLDIEVVPHQRTRSRAKRLTGLGSFSALRALQLLERLRQHGYTGGISILRERVRKLRLARTQQPR